MTKKRKRTIPAPLVAKGDGDSDADDNVTNSIARSALPGYPLADKDATIFPQLLAGKTSKKSPFPGLEVQPTVSMPQLLATGVDPKKKGGK
jgi:hypothetical protein